VARAFSALCALQAVLIGFFSVKIDVVSTGISSHFLADILCRGKDVNPLIDGRGTVRLMRGSIGRERGGVSGKEAA
jgi:hypothetical protein